MRTLKSLSVTLALAFLCFSAHGQVGRRLQDAANRAAERAATQQTERRTEDAVNKAIDGALDGNQQQNQQQQSQQQSQQQQEQQQAQPQQSKQSTAPATNNAAQTPQHGGNATAMAWNKFDFVAGDEIIFEDLLTGERLGEFPSRWDMMRGNTEIANLNGENVICLIKDAEISPLMANSREYLPDVFTIEADFYIYPSNEMTESHGQYRFLLRDRDNTEIVTVTFDGYPNNNTLRIHTNLKSN
jgi:hypothetical protein